MRYHQNLPAEVQRLVRSFEGEGDYIDLYKRLDLLLRDRVLDDFVDQGGYMDFIRQDFIKLYGDKHSYLQLPSLGDPARALMSTGNGKDDEKEFRPRRGDKNPPSSLPSFKPFAGSFKPRPKARKGREAEGEDVAAKSRQGEAQPSYSQILPH